jgi:hypothetical protein
VQSSDAREAWAAIARLITEKIQRAPGRSWSRSPDSHRRREQDWIEGHQPAPSCAATLTQKHKAAFFERRARAQNILHLLDVDL